MGKRPKSKQDRTESGTEPLTVRIIGGRFRGRRLLYSGDPRTRPMKDRIRESLFNLIGPRVAGMHAVDLFAGTGALGLEAVSRGAIGATLIEQHYPTARLIERNIDGLQAGDQCKVISADTMRWWRRASNLPATAWLVLCSPPFDFFHSRWEEMSALVVHFMHAAPAGSVLAVEAPDTFDAGLLPQSAGWDVRTYPPAQLAIFWTESGMKSLGSA